MANIKTSFIKTNAALIMLASIAALSGAYIGQYFYGLKPCVLCIYQRIPYVLIIIIGIFIYKYSSKINFSRVMLYFCSFVFMAGALLALFHVGIEKGIINEPMSCSVNTEKHFSSIKELRQAIATAPINSPKCKDVQFSIFGISMAGLNFMYSLLLSIYSFLVAKGLAPKSHA